MLRSSFSFTARSIRPHLHPALFSLLLAGIDTDKEVRKATRKGWGVGHKEGLKKDFQQALKA